VDSAGGALPASDCSAHGLAQSGLWPRSSERRSLVERGLYGAVFFGDRVRDLNYALTYMPSSRAAAVSYLQPLEETLLAVVLLGEPSPRRSRLVACSYWPGFW
jgi:hypothetical protein